MNNYVSSWSNPESTGLLPMIILPTDPQPAKVQINQRYDYGGGFYKFKAFELVGNFNAPINQLRLAFPGEPHYFEMSRIYLPLSKELVVLFQLAFVAIILEDGTFEVTCVD